MLEQFGPRFASINTSQFVASLQTIEFHQEEFIMARGRRIPFGQSSMQTAPIVGLWALRILIGLGMHRDFLSDHGFSSDALAQAIGLGNWIDSTRQDFDRKKVLLSVV
jgi:hypothetical protein